MGFFTNSALFSNRFRQFCLGLVLMLGALLPSNLSASHISGFDPTYEILSGNRLRVRVTIYRDCGGITLPNQLPVNVTGCGIIAVNANLPLLRTDNITCYCPSVQQQTNCGTGTNSCFEANVYEAIVQLPTMNCNNIVISYSGCCRNPAITNLQNPGSQGLYGETNFNGERLINQFGLQNSSPVFGNQPVPTICANQPFLYNHGASDPDGDSLVYTLIDARSAVNTNIPYVVPMNALFPIPSVITGTDTSFVFCTNSGQLSFTPTTPGSYVVVVRVDEYRRIPGTNTRLLIGSTMRDMQVQVNACASGGSLTNLPVQITEVDITTRGTCLMDSTTIYNPDVAACPGLPSNIISGGRFTVCAGGTICFMVVGSDPDGQGSITVVSNVNDIYPVTVNNTDFQQFPSPDNNNDVWATFTIQNVTQSGSFFVTFKDDACPVPSVQTIAFTINVNGVSIQSATNDVRLCAAVPYQQTYNLSARSTSVLPGTFTWSQVAGPQVTITPVSTSNTSNATILFPINIRSTNSVVLRVDFTDGNCVSSDGIVFNFDDYITSIAGPTAACAGISTTWSASTSLNGVLINDPNRYTSSTVTHNPCTLLPTPGATSVALTDDSSTPAIPIGFPFTFYGNTFNSAFIGSNGFITFGAGSSSFGNVALPAPFAPDNIITLAWDDWNPAQGGTITHTTVGTAPNRQFIVTYIDVPRFGQGTTPALTGQIVLNEATGCFDIRLISAISNSDATWAGYQNAAGTAGGGTLLPAPLNASCLPIVTICPVNTSFNWFTGTGVPISTTPSPSISYGPPVGNQQIVACLADATLTNGCFTCDTFNITVTSGLTAPTLTNCTPGIGQVVFQVGATDVNSTGFEWRPCTGGAWTPLAAGVNTITVTGLQSSAVGCAEVRSIGNNGVPCDNVPRQVTCTSLPCYTVSTTQVNPTCFGLANGQINITVTGYAVNLRIRRPGAPDLINLQSPISIGSLPAGFYPITITDGINCSTVIPLTLTSPPTLAVSVTAGQATCGNNGTLSSTVTGGVGPYTYNWSNATACIYTTSATNAACPGNYILTITDANGCTFNSAIVNVVAATTTMVAAPTTPRVCGGVANTQTQTYSTTVTGTTTGSYQWSQLGGTPSTLAGATTASMVATLGANMTTATAPVFQVVYTHSGTCAITATVSVDVDFQTLSATVSDATVCAGQTITLSSALSNPRPNVIASTSSYTVSTITYAPVTPVAPVNCTLTNGGFDDGNSRVNIGFPFSFFGTTYTQAFVGTNGYLTFGAGATSFFAGPIPDAGVPNNAIYLAWGDLLATANSMRTETLGSAPNRRFVLYFSNEDLFSGDIYTGQIVLYEGSNNIDVISTDINGQNELVQGIENLSGSYGLPVPGRNWTLFNAQNSSFRFMYENVVAFPAPAYAWATSTGTAVGNTQNVTTTQNTATTYLVTATYGGGCVYNASVTVNMGNTVTAPNITCGARTANSAEFLASTPAGATGMEYSINNGVSWNAYTGSFTAGGLVPGQCATLLARGTSSNADDCLFTVSAPTVCCAVNCFPFSTTTTPVSCAGSSNGGITVTPQGVTTTVDYVFVDRTTSAIVGTNTTGELTGLPAGNYRVSLTDTNGCVDFADVVIGSPSAISLTTSTGLASCNCNGTAGITATGGTAPYSYLWSNLEATQIITGLCSGDSFDATITDAVGCTALSTAVTISGAQPDLVSLTAPEVCIGESTTLSASWISGGAPGCTTVTSACTSASTSSLPFGNYSSLLTMTATDGNPLRRDVNDSRMQFLMLASDLRYMGVGTHKLSNLGFNVSRKLSTASTNWTIKLTCVSPTITQVGPTWINTSAGSTVFSGNVTTTAGYNFLPFDSHYTWDGTSNLVVEICADNSATNATDEIDGSVLTQQRVLFATSNTSLGCISDAVVPTATLQTPIFNFGMCLNSATYTWQSPSGAVFGPLNNTTLSITPTQSGTWTVTATENGCSLVTTTFVTVNNPIAAPVVSCGNANSNSLEFTWNTPVGATSFEYSTSASGPWTATNSNSATLSGLTGVTPYTLFVRAANVPARCTNGIGQQTCTTTNCTAVTTTTTAALCAGASNGTITATALTPGNFTFALFNGAGTQVGTTLSASPAAFTGLPAGAYSIRFNDLTNACSATYAPTVTQPTQLVATPGNTTERCYLAADGTAGVTASNGTAPYTISWSTNVLAAQVTQFAITGLTADVYTATVSDANGCSVVTSTTVNGPTQPIDVTFNTTPPTCLGAANGTASATVTGAQGAVSYAWTPANANSVTLTNVVQGPLSVVVTDANGCTNSFAATVATPAAITAAVTTQPACTGLNNASAAATFANYAGAVTYSWNVSGATTASIGSLAPNTNVIVTVNTGIGCTASASANTGAATVYTATVSSVQAPNCNVGANDGILTAGFTTAGVTSTTYRWDNLTTGAQRTGLTPGQNVVVTLTANNGCIATASGAALAVNQNLNATVTPSTPTCAGSSDGSATVTTNYTGTTPLTYTWTGNASNTATSNGYAANATAFVTVGGPFGCVATGTATVTYGFIGSGDVPYSLSTSQNRPTCSYSSDGSVLATVVTNRGSGYTYNYAWSPSNPNQPGINGLLGGTVVTVTVSILGIPGCETVTTTVVPSTPAIVLPTPTLVGSAPCSDNQRLAELTTSATGGNGTFSYAWNTGALSTNAVGLTAGTYSVVATDQLGCTTSASTTINSILTPDADIRFNGSVTNSVSNVSPGIDFGLPLTASGSPQVSTVYTWSSNNSEGILGSTNGFSVQSHSINATGIITVTYAVTASNNGCTATDDIIVQYSLPSIQFANIFTPNGDNNNDLFGPIVDGAQIQLVSFSVYNRWGAIVYQTTDRNSIQWDGRYQGEDCPRDMYIYQLRYIEAGRNVETITTGEVNLIR